MSDFTSFSAALGLCSAPEPARRAYSGPQTPAVFDYLDVAIRQREKTGREGKWNRRGAEEKGNEKKRGIGSPFLNPKYMPIPVILSQFPNEVWFTEY